MAKLGGNPTAGSGTTNVAIVSSVELEVKNDAGSPLAVSGTVAVTQPVAVTDNGGSLTVDGVFFQATQPVSGTVTANAGTGPFPVSDNGGSLTVDGIFFQATQPVSGTVTANAGTGPWPVTDNGGSLTVDGVFFQATQPVSGTVTANAGTGPWPVTDNAGSLTVDAPVGTPAFVRLSDGAAALLTPNGSLNANLARVVDTATVTAAAGVQKVGIGSGATGNSFIEGTAANLAAFSGAGSQLIVPTGQWTVVSAPAVSTKASASKAAGAAGVRHVCTSVSFGWSWTTALGAITTITINLRDGATGAGAVLWTWQYTLPTAVPATDHFANISLSGLNLVGTAATAMTLEFGALLTNLLQFCNIAGYDAA